MDIITKLTEEEISALAEQGIFIEEKHDSFSTGKLDLAIRVSDRISVGQRLVVKDPTNHTRSKEYVESRLSSDFRVTTVVNKAPEGTKRQLIIKRIK